MSQFKDKYKSVLIFSSLLEKPKQQQIDYIEQYAVP